MFASESCMYTVSLLVHLLRSYRTDAGLSGVKAMRSPQLLASPLETPNWIPGVDRNRAEWGEREPRGRQMGAADTMVASSNPRVGGWRRKTNHITSLMVLHSLLSFFITFFSSVWHNNILSWLEHFLQIITDLYWNTKKLIISSSLQCGHTIRVPPVIRVRWGQYPQLLFVLVDLLLTIWAVRFGLS